MNKRKVIWIIAGVVFALWLAAVIYINISSERQRVKVYEIGDVVPFGQNYYEESYEIIDGYKAQVISGNIYKYEDYLTLMDIPGQKDSHQKYVYDLEICFYNEDLDSERGINLVSTYLASSDDRLAINIDLLTQIYPQLGDSPTEFRIRPGTSMVMHIPFQMEYISALYVGDEEKFLKGNEFYLNVTQYPEKQLVRIPAAKNK